MLGMEYFVSRGPSKIFLTDLPQCLSLFGLIKQNTPNSVAYEQQKFMAHCSGVQSPRSGCYHDG